MSENYNCVCPPTIQFFPPPFYPEYRNLDTRLSFIFLSMGEPRDMAIVMHDAIFAYMISVHARAGRQAGRQADRQKERAI